VKTKLYTVRARKKKVLQSAARGWLQYKFRRKPKKEGGTLWSPNHYVACRSNFSLCNTKYNKQIYSHSLCSKTVYKQPQIQLFHILGINYFNIL